MKAAVNPMNRRRLLLPTIALALVVVAGAMAWLLFFRPIDVQVSQPERDVLVQVFGLGTVEARVTSKVGFKASGVLVELRADVGDRVAKGAVLARLASRVLRTEYFWSFTSSVTITSSSCWPAHAPQN